MSTVRYSGGVGKKMGVVEEYKLTVVAASTFDDDGRERVAPEEIGRRRLERSVAFAFRAEAEAWIAEQAAEGFTSAGGPVPLATFYQGPTDSTSNAWRCRVWKELPDA